MEGPKAIETKYKGHHFRSRMETRWAVFLDALDEKWEYEKEGYDLGGAGRYLPDFWLPRLETWVEIKADGEASDAAKRKCAALARQTRQDVLLFAGLPPIGLEETGLGWLWMPTGASSVVSLK